jgi:hypothetical protein
VTELRTVTVIFNTPVSGVLAGDFLINNQPAAAVAGSGTTYIFSFVQPPFGTVDITWEAGTDIRDLADPANIFNPAASSNWSYQLRDITPPSLVAIIPPGGATVSALTDVELRFSEEVTGIDRSDLLMNGSAATNLDVRPQNTYVFHFAAPAAGLVKVEWAGNHNISDLADPPNAFSGTGWSYRLEAQVAPSAVVISEFLASAETRRD